MFHEGIALEVLVERSAFVENIRISSSSNVCKIEIRGGNDCGFA